MSREIIRDALGAAIEPGDLVIYADNYPMGRSPYIGKVSHITRESGRIALKIRTSTYVAPPPGSPGWKKGHSYYEDGPMEFNSHAQVYRESKTLFKYEQ